MIVHVCFWLYTIVYMLKHDRTNFTLKAVSSFFTILHNSFILERIYKYCTTPALQAYFMYGTTSNISRFFCKYASKVKYWRFFFKSQAVSTIAYKLWKHCISLTMCLLNKVFTTFCRFITDLYFSFIPSTL